MAASKITASPRSGKQIWAIAVALVSLLVIAVILFLNSSYITLSKLRKQGKLIVAIRNAPTIFYEGSDGLQGFEYELLANFARYAGVELELRIVDGISELLDEVEQGRCHIGSGAITRTPTREKKYHFGPDFYQVRQTVVYKRGKFKPRNIQDLTKGSLEVVAESSYEELLKILQKAYPDLIWRRTTNISTDQLMYKVWQEEIDFTIADDNIALINQRYFPELQIGFPLSEEQSLAWLLSDEMQGLRPVIAKWLRKFKAKGKFTQLENKYYGFTEIYDYVDIRKFHDRIESRLPLYRDHFISAGKKYDIPWTLLAAQAYQESHWNKRAKSPTGVRGIMMLTLNTAARMGVKSRIDPLQSIEGGARYMAQLLKQVPSDITGRDRIAFALASYNVGLGHMLDAQILADRLGYNPLHWLDLKDVLPFLCQEKYYKDLKHGYARGTESVRYVDQIFDYQDILENIIEQAATDSSTYSVN